MRIEPLIDVAELAARLAEPALVVVDCRFNLADPGAGRAAYLAGHLPRAVHADLERHLSAEAGPATGRHPLPGTADFEAAMRELGISADSSVVAYDEANGMFAARLWWMLRWAGHDDVRVLDGGIQRWRALGQAVEAGAHVNERGDFRARESSLPVASTADVARLAAAPGWRVLDARTPERYRGEVEPIDPVAGHVPGAANLPSPSTVNSDGCLRPAAELRAMFATALGDVAPDRVITMCGSGVAACHLLLALEHAGLSGARLYAGSWSEWIRDPARPVGRGDGP